MPHHQIELLKPPQPCQCPACQAEARDWDLTPAVTTGPQVLTMVGTVTAGAVLIAGLNANTAVRSAQLFLLPCACRAA